MGKASATGTRIERIDQPEPDRVTVRTNGIVVDIIGNDYGGVYVEFYAFEGPSRTAITMRTSDGDDRRSPAVWVEKAPRVDPFEDRAPNGMHTRDMARER